MKIAIIGAGAVGGYFGARLAAAGNHVTFVARGAHLDSIRRDGLTVHSPRGDLHIQPARAIERIADLEPADLALVTVKLWDTEDVARQLKPLAEKGAAILSLQNGVEKEALLRRHLGAGSILGGVCYISAAIEAPGVIVHSGPVQRIVFGELDGRPSARTQSFLEACTQAAIDAEISSSIDQLIWEKFVFLVGLSAATTTMRQPLGPILRNAQARSFLRDVMGEVVALARAKGVPLSPGYADERIAFCDTLPATMTSSMHRDLERGNRLELPWLSGAVVRLGMEHGVQIPLNRAVRDVLSLYTEGQPR